MAIGVSPSLIVVVSKKVFSLSCCCSTREGFSLPCCCGTREGSGVSPYLVVVVPEKVVGFLPTL